MEVTKLKRYSNINTDGRHPYDAVLRQERIVIVGQFWPKEGYAPRRKSVQLGEWVGLLSFLPCSPASCCSVPADSSNRTLCRY